jgi:Rrf2 family protein
MIRVSTRGRYALRAMLDIALQGGDRPVRRASIADRQGISSEYAAQLFRELIAAGLANSTKGPGGGYHLAKPAKAIRAGDIVRAVEGPIAVVDCVAASSRKPCSRTKSCVTHRLWQRLSGSMEEVLDSMTLADLVAEAQQLADSGECPA